MKYIAALLLSGCSTIPQQIDSARYTAQLSGRTHCYLTGGVIAWSSRGEIERLCGPNSLGCEINRLVITRKPESWNDWAALRTLGHEVLHLCNEQHEVVR